jgi:truncated hemoglobin YjbI
MIGAMVHAPHEPLPVTAGPELFDALGGRATVGMIVDGLYDRLERDRELSRLFRSPRQGERARLKEFFEGLFGGEVRGIRDVGMQRRHIHRLISAGESARWLAHFGAAMDEAGVTEGPQAAVMYLLQGAAARLVNDGAPKEVLKQALLSAGKGDMDAVVALVAEHPRLIDQRGRDGVTMLWTAARRGRMPLVRWLVARGADVEIPGSAVHVTQVMVSPYCIAVRSRRGQVAQYLLDHGAQVDVFCAAFLGDLDMLRGHIAAGLANAQSPHEDFHPITPLHHAVDGGSVAAATLLLENGAEARTSGGRLLNSAANQGSIELVRLLLDHGANASDAESTHRRAAHRSAHEPVRRAGRNGHMRCCADAGRRRRGHGRGTPAASRGECHVREGRPTPARRYELACSSPSSQTISSRARLG